MKLYSHKECYQILNIEPGCSYNELKKAYKTQIQKWHPDRYADKSIDKITAESKIRQITSANQQLSAYYKRNLVLPYPTHRIYNTTIHNSGNQSNNQNNPEPLHSRRKKYVASLLLLLVISAGTGFLIWKYALNYSSLYSHRDNITTDNTNKAQ